ncbi:hypothetical protein AAVH_23381, partial [Aphelenchoides avenae]
TGETTPYAIDGTICDLEWEEVYACNNGGGLYARECVVTVKTGITTEDTNSTSGDRSSGEQTDVETGKTVDKSTSLGKVVSKGTTFGLKAGAKGGVERQFP